MPKACTFWHCCIKSLSGTTGYDSVVSIECPEGPGYDWRIVGVTWLGTEDDGDSLGVRGLVCHGILPFTSLLKVRLHHLDCLHYWSIYHKSRIKWNELRHNSMTASLKVIYKRYSKSVQLIAHCYGSDSISRSLFFCEGMLSYELFESTIKEKKDIKT